MFFPPTYFQPSIYTNRSIVKNMDLSNPYFGTSLGTPQRISKTSRQCMWSPLRSRQRLRSWFKNNSRNLHEQKRPNTRGDVLCSLVGFQRISGGKEQSRNERERRWPGFAAQRVGCVGSRWRERENQRTGWKTGPYAHEQRLVLSRSHAFFFFLVGFNNVESEDTPIHRTWWNKYIWQHGTDSSNKVTIFSINHNKLMAKIKYFIHHMFLQR